MNEGLKSDAAGDARGTATSSSRRVSEVLRWSLLLGVIVVGGYHLGLQVSAMRLPPMGSWETIYASAARVWPHQYQWANFVEGHDGYGPGYSTFVRPFLATGLDVYVAHRLANLVAILLACALVAHLLLKNGCSRLFTAVATTIFYALNAGSYSIQARPDFLVLLEITAMFALGDAVARGRVKLDAKFGLVFGTLALAAFLTKAYSLSTWGTILAYLAIFVSWRGAVIAGFISAAILGGGIGLFAAFNPLYAMEVFQGQIVQATPTFAWLRHQTLLFSFFACGLVVIVLLSAAGWLKSRGKAGAAPNVAERFWKWQFLLAAISLLLGPGAHTGAYLTYFFHLLLVPLVVLAGFQAAKVPVAADGWQRLALLVNLAVLMIFSPSWPRHDASWAALREDILNEPGRVAVDYIMEPIAREKPGIALVSTGQSGYTLKEPFLIARETAVVVRARAEATEYIRQQTALLFGERPVETIYLDCLTSETSAAGQPRLRVFPRNQLPYFLSPEMENYIPIKAYHIRPYYFATNAPRQDAGEIETTIVKFVRKK